MRFRFSPFCLTLAEAYWKNFTLCSPDEIALTFQTATEVGGRVQPGEVDEVVDEVGLVKVPTSTGDVRPIYFRACLHFEQDLLKTTNTAKHLGREAGLSPEQVNEVFVAESDLA